jgi:hypothetical protein
MVSVEGSPAIVSGGGDSALRPSHLSEYKVKVQEFCKMFWAMLILFTSVSGGRKENEKWPEERIGRRRAH